VLAGRDRVPPTPQAEVDADAAVAAELDAAWRSTRRALWIWLFALALLTLAGLVA
jgi:hypothetical protein